MIVYLEVAAIWFGVTTVVYLLVAVYSRSVRRESLEKEFDASFPPVSGPDAGVVAADRDTYVSDGMASYGHGLRRRLIGLIYVLPAVAFVVVIYVVNYR